MCVFCKINLNLTFEIYLQSVGLADTLQFVRIPIVGNNECTCTYSYLTENMLCAGLTEGGKDSCQVTTTFCVFVM